MQCLGCDTTACSCYQVEYHPTDFGKVNTGRYLMKFIREWLLVR